jgi:hypothetical protein
MVAGFGVRLAYRVSVASDMTSIMIATIASKDRLLGTVPPNLGFDTHPQRGCSLSRYRAFGGLGGGVFVTGSDLGR